MKARVKEISYASWKIAYRVEIHRFLWNWDYLTELSNKNSAIDYCERINKRHLDSLEIKETII